MRKTALLILLLAVFIQCKEDVLHGKVVKIADGETFTLLVSGNTQVKIRLYGIDAPEKGQDFSQVSKDFLGELLLNKTVVVVVNRKDRYGRIVGVVKADDKNINEELLKAGMAWHYTDFDKNPVWADYERSAREKKAGLWAHNDPVPPWKYRKKKVQAGK